MNYRKALAGFITVFTITLIISIAVTFLWNLIFNESAFIDWQTSFTLAIILGIILSINDVRKQKNRNPE
jgi:hypothetical protein